MEAFRKRWLATTCIDWPCYMQIFKGALAPTIVLACGQATTWIRLLGTLGYIVPVAVIICYPMRPRTQFLKALLLNILTVCFTAAVTLLAMFCILKARRGTAAYDSSASTVAALWLLVMTFIITAVRANNAGMAFPCSAALIFSNYGLVYAAEYTKMQQAYTFIQELLLAHLIGFAISLGTNLLLFPTTSRQPFFDTLTKCLSTARSILDANHSLRALLANNDLEGLTKSIERVRVTTATLGTLQSQLATASVPAIEEFALSGMTSKEREELYYRTREIMTVLIGTRQLAEIAAATVDQLGGDESPARISATELGELLNAMKTPLDQACSASSDGIGLALMDLGLQHCDRGVCRSYAELSDKGVADHHDFIEHMHACSSQLIRGKEALVIPQLRSNENGKGCPREDAGLHNLAVRNQAFAVLHSHILTWTTTQRVLEILEFTQHLRSSGRRGQSMFAGCWKALQNSSQRCFSIRRRALHPAGPDTIKDKAITQKYQDPVSHFPTRWTVNTKLYLDMSFFASPAASFALRVSAAVMSIAIVAFLKDTQKFYIKQHLFWAQYTVSFAMQATTGQSIRHFFLRLCGTVVAVVMALLSYYIVVGHRAGELVFYFLFMHIPIYLMVKQPRLQATGTVSAFALTIVLGNKLQLQKLGSTTAEQLGLAVQPMWLIAMIRLASIGGGLLLATIWTVFPCPISEHDLVRQSAVACLNSSARYYASTHMTVTTRLTTSPRVEGKGTAGIESRFTESRDRSTTDIDTQLSRMSQHLNLVKWSVPGRTRFSRTPYDSIHDNLSTLVRSTDRIRLASLVFTGSVATEDNLASSAWLRRFRSVIDGTAETSEQATTLLMVLANCLNTQTPLPPYLRVPNPLLLSESLTKIDKDMLSVLNIAEPGLATFAAIQVEIQHIHKCLTELLAAVEKLVGTLDIDFAS